MRSEDQMMNLLLSVASADERVRAVILNGSRTNKRIRSDKFQDYDVIFLVDDMAGFRANEDWIDVFGERIIMQMPNAMKIDPDDIMTEEEIVYLILFKDFNRIDLRLVSTENKENCTDSLNKVVLDKDGLFEPGSAPSDEDYRVKKPSQKEFTDCCNEFWWVTTYVAKGLARNEPLYAKEMLEGPVRKMFLRMMAWKVGTETEFSANVGQGNRFLRQYVSAGVWSRILKTYPDANLENIRKSVREMTRLFHETALEVSDDLRLPYNQAEANNVHAYLKEIKVL